MSLNFLALATRTSWPHSSSKRLTQGEWVPTSIAILRAYSESKRRLRASGVVRSLPSSMTSPLAVSMRQRQLYLSPRSNPAVIFGWSLLPSISRADPPFQIGPLASERARIAFADPEGTAYGGRPSHLIFREDPSLLKNAHCARFHPRSGTKYAAFGAVRARFLVAMSSMPTFSTGWGVLGNRYTRSCMNL